MVSFKDRLRKLRKEKDKSIREAADDLEIGKTTLSNYERGERVPNKDFINKAANYYNVSTDYLLCRTNNKYPSSEIKQTLEENPELMQFWEQISSRDDLQLLFKQTKDLSPRSIKSVVEFMKSIEDEHRREG